MNRSIKLRRAVGTHGTVHRVADLQQRHDTKQTLPTLLCDSPGCGALLKFVPARSSRHADQPAPVQVPAYLTLDKGAEHQPGCRYDAPGHLQALLDVGADPDFLPVLADGRQELRLLVLQQALKRGSADRQAVDSATDRYLHTLADLLVLRALCESDALFAEHLTLRLGKKKVDWANFFYTPERYDEAGERLAAASTELPMALLGTVRSQRVQPDAVYLNCAPKYQRTGITDRRDFHEVSVGHGDAAWLQSFPVGAEIVMFGLWRQGRTTTSTRPHPTDPRRTITNVTHKLALWPSFKRQLAVVD